MIFDDENVFKKLFEDATENLYGKTLSHCTDDERFTALSSVIMTKAAEIRKHNADSRIKKDLKHIYYFSAEFLPGRFLKSNLINLGELANVTEYLSNMGMDIDELCKAESDPALGNGGLGRLAACFMDSLATLGIEATGMGIRYRYGLFKQRIENGCQKEEPDLWLGDYYVWEKVNQKESVIVRFGGTVNEYIKDGSHTFSHTGGMCVLAIPYDIPIIGYGGECIDTLRLWSSQPYNEKFNLEAFDRGDWAGAIKDRIEAESISYVLYPNDSIEKGRELRLKQEYFFVCAGITDIIRKYKLKHSDPSFADLSKHISIHINDTHPSLCIPELMRQLIDNEGLEWDAAWSIVTKTVSYTNHTIMPESLEKWSIDMFIRILPRIYKIIEEVDRRYRASIADRPDHAYMIQDTSILWDGQVRMANLSVIGSYSVNGVAALHSEILKNDTLKSFYILYPERFCNKTNGVSHRRFLLESNKPLSDLITHTIGEDWKRDPLKLEELLKYKEDTAFLKDLAHTKRINKERLADYIWDNNHIEVDPGSVFDVQTKRIHAYKRQHLNIFKVMALYNELKAHPDISMSPVTFIFAGKAGASYLLAKEIISLICTAADVINSDKDINGRLRVVFLENFNVSLGQLIYPAADISEQISTAGREASGTGNMKFMFNGAVTIGTLDGANIEIRDLVGDDNIYIFGLRSDETARLRRDGTYSAFDEYKNDPVLRSVIDSLTDGSLNDLHSQFNNIYGDLLYKNDEYFVLKDFSDYLKTWKRMMHDQGDLVKWNRMSLHNIAKAGTFTSDRAIREYMNDIWTRYH